MKNFNYIIEKYFQVFIVLRKKWKQISFLHLYHHTIMCICPWFILKFYPGGHGCMLGIVNSFVHTVMYTYYLVTLYNPRLRNSVFKKYVTQLQLFQFGFLLFYYMLPIVFPVAGCTYPKVLLFFFAAQNLIMIILFSNFFIKTYGRKELKVE